MLFDQTILFLTIPWKQQAEATESKLISPRISKLTKQNHLPQTQGHKR